MDFFYDIGIAVMNFFKDVQFGNFVDNLKYMGAGMLGIFAVIFVIVLIITVFQKVSKTGRQ